MLECLTQLGQGMEILKEFVISQADQAALYVQNLPKDTQTSQKIVTTVVHIYISSPWISNLLQWQQSQQTSLAGNLHFHLLGHQHLSTQSSWLHWHVTGRARSTMAIVPCKCPLKQPHSASSRVWAALTRYRPCQPGPTRSPSTAPGNSRKGTTAN